MTADRREIRVSGRSCWSRRGFGGSRSGERGSSRFGCLVMLVFFVSLAFVAYKVGPVYIDKLEFESQLDSVIRQAGANEWNQGKLVEAVLTTARDNHFEITRDSVKVSRSNRQVAGRLVVEVHFSRRVEFPGYVHVFRFQTEISTFIGRL